VTDQYHRVPVEHVVEQAGDQPLVFRTPQRREAETFQFPPISSTQPCSRQAEHGLATRILFKNKSIGKQLFYVCRLDLRALWRRTVPAQPIPIMEQCNGSCEFHVRSASCNLKSDCPNDEQEDISDYLHAVRSINRASFEAACSRIEAVKVNKRFRLRPRMTCET